MNPSSEAVMTGSKIAVYLNHLKNNRIEYLVLGLILHTLGIFDRIYQQTNGVCL